jgi:fructoselysine-6-P-deglycase FrlB-like protein
MNAIEAMQAEIEYQVEDLPKLGLPKASENCLFVGAGDSYVASLAAQYVSAGHALCCYPTDVILNPSVASDRNMYVVSISGNTRANIMAAQAAKKHGARTTTAITARPESRLARSCDKVIQLKYRSVGVTTAGTISFASSILACLSLTKQVRLPASLGRIYRQASDQAEKAAGKIRSRDSSYIILGNGPLYLASLYGVLKFNEVFGAKAFAYPVEEFCHSPLFSVSRGDRIIVMGAEGDDNSSLSERLCQEGYSSVYVDFGKKEKVELLLQPMFFVQLLVVRLAQKRRLTSCYFLKNRSLLRVSSDFIY